LEQDAAVLSQELISRGHEVTRVQFDRPQFNRADVNVFLEIINEQMLGLANQNWIVPNPEWYYIHWPRAPFRWFLAKTHDSGRRFATLVNGKCRYIGWRSRDLYRPAVRRERKFLHVAGKSRFKNTDAVEMGCGLAGVPVTVVRDGIGRISDDYLAELFNSHAFFLCPSQYEGYGMALHEALGCGAVIITTDAAPMNEIAPSVLIPSEGVRQYNFGTLHTVSAAGVAEAVNAAMEFSDDEISRWREAGRAAYEEDVQAFSRAMDDLLGEA
jgi:hypothetical protein